LLDSLLQEILIEKCEVYSYFSFITRYAV